MTIVTGHDGNLLIDSQPGAGSTFTIVLPVAPILVGARPGTDEDDTSQRSQAG